MGSLVGSLSSLGLSASILHGEVYALILAVLQSASSSSAVSVYSDHHPSVCCVVSFPDAPSSLRSSFTSSPARSLHRWLHPLVVASPLLSLHPVHAHSSSTTPAALANRLVDLYATSARNVISYHHRPFQFQPLRWTGSHLSNFVSSLLAFSLSQDLFF